MKRHNEEVVVMKRWMLFAGALALALVVAGCAGPNVLAGTQGSRGVAGFWAGLWHGMICPVAFVISLFNHGVSMYEVHNSGWPYNLGFLFGASMCFGGAGRGSHGGKRDRR